MAKDDKTISRYGKFIKQKIDLSSIELYMNELTKKFFNEESYSNEKMTHGLFEYGKLFKCDYIESKFSKNKSTDTIIVYPDYKNNKYVLRGYYNDNTDPKNMSIYNYLKYLYAQTYINIGIEKGYKYNSNNGIEYYDFTSFNDLIKVGIYKIYMLLSKDEKSKNKSAFINFEGIVNTIMKFKYHNFISKLEFYCSSFTDEEFEQIVDSCSIQFNKINFRNELFDAITEYNYIECPHFFVHIIDKYKIEETILLTGLYVIWLYLKKNNGLAFEISSNMKFLQQNKLDVQPNGIPIPKNESDDKGESEPDISSQNTKDSRTKKEIIDDSIEYQKNKIFNDSYESINFENALRNATKQWGSETGFDKFEVGENKYKEYDINDNLAKYSNVSSAMTTEYKFNRKKMYKVYERKIIPYNHRLKQKGSALILIDASGSCTSYISKFLQNIFHPKVISEIYYFDTKLLISTKNNIIRNKKDLMDFIKDIPIGGGTDLNVPFEELKKIYNNRLPRNIFIFTDGFMNKVDIDKYSGTIITYTTHEFIEFKNDSKCKQIKIKITDPSILL